MEIIFLPCVSDYFKANVATVDLDDIHTNFHFGSSLISMKLCLSNHRDLFTDDEMQFLLELIESEDKGNALWAYGIIKNKEIWI